MNLVSCPECHQPARITDRFSLGSTSGGLEHVKTRCPEGHWFTMREEDVQAYRPARPQRRAAAAVPVLAARLGLL